MRQDARMLARPLRPRGAEGAREGGMMRAVLIVASGLMGAVGSALMSSPAGQMTLLTALVASIYAAVLINTLD